MNIIRTCPQCGAEQPSWMGGSHAEVVNGIEGCFDTDHKKRWSQYFLAYRFACWAHLARLESDGVVNARSTA